MWRVQTADEDSPAFPTDEGFMDEGDARKAAALLLTPSTERSTLTSPSSSDLPDSAFAYIEPGGTKDPTGRTTPRSLRHFPVHDAAHARNALARASSSPFGAKAMPKILAACKKFNVDVAQNSRPDRDALTTVYVIRPDGSRYVFTGEDPI